MTSPTWLEFFQQVTLSIVPPLIFAALLMWMERRLSGREMKPKLTENQDLKRAEARAERYRKALQLLADAAFAMSVQEKNEEELIEKYGALNDACATAFDTLKELGEATQAPSAGSPSKS